MSPKKVLVYCASSESSDPVYRTEAHRLGCLIADAGHSLVYGGGAAGSMRAVADGALSGGATVVGVTPHFMRELEWTHDGLTEIHYVDDMGERKRRMLERADAVVALPGGCGTFEELFEVLSLKRLGLFFGPIVVVNARGFYDPMIEMFARSVEERFMDERHLEMWEIVGDVEAVIPAIAAAQPWPADARSFATR